LADFSASLHKSPHLSVAVPSRGWLEFEGGVISSL
jgi:hypothetical protein